MGVSNNTYQRCSTGLDGAPRVTCFDSTTQTRHSLVVFNARPEEFCRLSALAFSSRAASVEEVCRLGRVADPGTEKDAERPSA
jgi:hypothetical protein